MNKYGSDDPCEDIDVLLLKVGGGLIFCVDWRSIRGDGRTGNSVTFYALYFLSSLYIKCPCRVI